MDKAIQELLDLRDIEQLMVRYADRIDANALLPGRGRPVRTFNGPAPPGSFVQLRIDEAERAGGLVAGEGCDAAVLGVRSNDPGLYQETRRQRIRSQDHKNTGLPGL